MTRQVQYGMFFLAIYEFSSHRIKPHNLVFSWGKFVDADDVSYHQHTRPTHTYDVDHAWHWCEITMMSLTTGASPRLPDLNPSHPLAACVCVSGGAWTRAPACA